MRRGSGSVGWPVPKTPVVPGSNLAISNFYKEHKFPFNYKRQKHNEKGCKSSPFFNMTKQRLQDKMFISIFDGTFPPLSLSISQLAEPFLLKPEVLGSNLATAVFIKNIHLLLNV